MPDWLGRLPNLPLLGDKESAQTAFWIRLILRVLLVATAVIIVPFWVTQSWNSLLIAILTGLALLSLLLLVWRGHARLASLLLIVLLLIVTTVAAADAEVPKASVTSAYFLILTLAALLFGADAVLVIAGLSILALWGLYFSRTQTVPLVHPISMLATQTLITTLFMATTGVVLRLMIQQLHKTLGRVRRNEQALLESNRELETEIQERKQAAARLAVVNHIAHAVGNALHLDDLLETVHHEITSSFRPDALFVALYDPENNELEFRLQVDEGVQQPPERRPMTEGLTSIVVGEVRPLLVRDFPQESHLLPTPQVWGTMKAAASWLGVPMLVGERVIGVISVQSYRPHAYNEEDQVLLSTIADQVAVAVERARLIQTLQTSEARYRTLFEEANDAVFLETMDGRIIDANEKACHLLGYDRDAFLTMSVADIVPPEVRDTLPQIIEEELEKGGIRLETENLHRDGSRVPVEVSTTLLQMGDERLVMALVRDTTERRRAEQFLKSLNQAALDMARTLSPDGVFATVAQAFQDLGMFCMVFLLDETQTQLSPVYVSHGEQAIAAAQRLLGTEMEDFTFAVDQMDLARQVVHERCVVFAEKTQEIMAQVLPSSTQDLSESLIRLFKMGRFIAAPLEAEGRVLGVLSVQADDLRRDDVPVITAFAHQMAAAWRKAQLVRDLEQSLKELKRTQHQLLQAQKMEAVGRLAGGLAHDYSNMLTIIRVSTELLHRKLHHDDPLREHVRQIQEATDRAGNLTKQLLSFSRREIIEPRVLDLSQALDELSHMLRRIIGEDIKLMTALAANLWAVKVDPSLIEQAIVNLVVNARDAMPNGGRLSLETANVILDESYAAQHLDVEPGEYVQLTVSDTGVGMTEHVQAHLFEPFFTTKDRGKGTGLGLATVFGIVKQHSGHIWVYSEVGQGTAFKIYLPRASGKAAPARQVPQVQPRAKVTGGTETVLVVEDNVRVQELIVRILETHGYQVLAAGNGQEALKVRKAHDGPIHLLLTDVVMPEMNGKELSQRLQVEIPDLRVLYMSGYDDNVIAHHGVLDKGTAFLPKPFNVDTLADKVRAVLEAEAPA